MPIASYLLQFFKPIHLQSIIRTANLLTFYKPMYLPFTVRKTLRLRVYVTSISNGSILHNIRQQTVTNDNKREQGLSYKYR